MGERGIKHNAANRRRFMAKTSGLHFKVAELFANIIPPLGAISNSKQGLSDCVGTKKDKSEDLSV
jgi:hypothetical protein